MASGTVGAVSFSEKPPQKFGLQIDAPKRLKVYPSGEKSDKGTLIVVKAVKTIDQLNQRIATQLKLLPSVRGLYTVDGQLMASLEALQDGQILIAVKKGHTFKKELGKIPRKIDLKETIIQ
eukprot:TRINITY_DN4025_c0_g1_i1.p1 TRINITY_DN4025_c0_g1~~TRINITY_DN4025_c0_g1_i1.p1  ORF type:complete len:130 (-),score=43.05 TRINITY_DN4025_c0_g1_i1:61-423(-)